MSGVDTDADAQPRADETAQTGRPSPPAARGVVWRTRAALTGGALGLLIQWWMVTGGTWDLFRARRDADYFDAQAHAWLEGHWWVPPRVVGIEGIVVDGHTQMYFGPLPALLRLPVALFTDALDARLSAFSMLAAACLAVYAALRLLGQVQRIRRPDAVISMGDAVAAGALAFALPAGTTLLFLASRTLVYHEASMWGVALSLLALSFVIEAAEHITTRNLALSCIAATAAISSRVSIGLGPMFALALLAVVLTYRARRPAWGAALAAAVPLIAYAVVNWIRFRTLFSVPLRDQVRTMLDPASHRFLEANDGYFGLQFVPTSLVAYLRPTGLRFSGWFPFVDFPRDTRVIGDATFDTIQNVVSAPVAMPALVGLALAGAVLLARRHAPTSLRIAALGAVAGCVTIFVFGYISYRYVGDLLPLLLILGVVAIDAIVGARPRSWRPIVVTGLAVLAVFGIWVNLGLGFLQQGTSGSQVDPDDVARFVDLRLDVNDRLGWATPVVHRVARDGRLPRRADPGDFAVVGNCAALYILSDVKRNFLEPVTWRPVERSRRSGARHLEARLRPAPAGTVERLLTIGAPERPGALELEHLGRGRARLVWRGPPDTYRGRAFTIDPGVHRLDVTSDPYIHQMSVAIDGDIALEGYFGAAGLATTYGNVIVTELRGNGTPLCRSLQRS